MSVDHYENFPVASVVLPRRLRPAVVAIYRFARTADDIADEGNVGPDERLARLAELRSGLEAIAAGRRPDAEPLAMLARAVANHHLPLAPFHALLDAFAQDVVTTRYASFDDLLGYCRNSADPVGRLLLTLYDAATPVNLVRSDRICTALQLVNFWQDIAIDWQKGRVYLPLEDLARFGVDESSIAEGRCDPRWRRLLAFEVERTRALFDTGRPLGHTLPGRLGLEMRMIIAGGSRILDRIDASGGDVFHHRPVLTPLDWVRIGVRAVLSRPQ